MASIHQCVARLAALLLPLFLIGCGGGGGGGGTAASGQPPVQTVVASSSVGPSGGTVSVTDPRSSLVGTSVTIPAGALTAPVNITISSLAPGFPASDGLEFVGPIAVFGPAGLDFQQPVTITLPSTRSFSENQGDLIHEFIGGGTWSIPADLTNDESHGQGLDSTTNSLSYSTLHFSTRARLTLPNVETLLSTSAPEAQLSFTESRCKTNCQARPVPITEIIVHSTNGPVGGTFAREVTYAATNAKFFAHYYVGKDGRIVQIAPDNIRAPHTGGQPPTPAINDQAIGIELYQPQKPNKAPALYSDYTDAQIAALVLLTRSLMQKYSIDVTGIHRHKEKVRDDENHMDPYGWSEENWQDFLAKLGPRGVSVRINSAPCINTSQGQRVEASLTVSGPVGSATRAFPIDASIGVTTPSNNCGTWVFGTGNDVNCTRGPNSPETATFVSSFICTAGPCPVPMAIQAILFGTDQTNLARDTFTVVCPL